MTRPGVCVIITRCCHPPPVPGYRMSWPAHGHLRNNNIKCLLSLSRKTNLIIRSANKSLASNMVLIFRLSLSKVNTRVVSQLGNAEHSCFYLTVCFKKVPSSPVSAVSQTRAVQEISPSSLCLWSSPGHRRVISPGPPGHKYYRVIVAEINYHRLREDGRIFFFCFNWCPETRNYNWYKFQDLIIPLLIPTIGRRGRQVENRGHPRLLAPSPEQKYCDWRSGPRNI